MNNHPKSRQPKLPVQNDAQVGFGHTQCGVEPIEVWIMVASEATGEPHGITLGRKDGRREVEVDGPPRRGLL